MHLAANGWHHHRSTATTITIQVCWDTLACPKQSTKKGGWKPNYLGGLICPGTYAEGGATSSLLLSIRLVFFLDFLVLVSYIKNFLSLSPNIKYFPPFRKPKIASSDLHFPILALAPAGLSVRHRTGKLPTHQI